MRLVVLLLMAAAATAAATSRNNILCCPTGGRLTEGRFCPDGTAVNINCSLAYYVNDPEELVLDADGSLSFGTNGGRIEESLGLFCVIDLLPNGSVSGAIVCFPESEEADRPLPLVVYQTYGALLMVSVAFLAATLAVYLGLPPLRDRDGLCLSAYMFSLALGSGSLALLQFISGVIEDSTCVIMAFFTYYWLLSAFFWLNVVAFNVWQCVTAKRVRLRSRALAAALLAYGWGTPLVFLIAALSVHHAPPHLHLLGPGFGERRCWFSTQLQSWAYFFGPVAVLLAANLVLFLWAAVVLWRAQPTTASLRPHKTLRFRCQLYTKLSLIMGVTWLLEVISFATGDYGYAWLVADVVNCLQGVLIFLLLVAFRRRVRRLLLAHCSPAARCFGVQPSPLSQNELPSDDEEEEDCDNGDATSDDARELKGAEIRANGQSQ